MAEESVFFNPQDTDDTPVDILDAQNRPFAVMPYGEARRQELKHRLALCLPRGRNNAVYLTRTLQDGQPGVWHAGFSGTVRAGEAAEEAAWRLLAKYTHHQEDTLFPGGIFEIKPPVFSLNACLYVFRTFPVKNVILRDVGYGDGLFVDQEELAAIYRTMPDSFGKEILWAWKHRILF